MSLNKEQIMAQLEVAAKTEKAVNEICGLPETHNWTDVLAFINSQEQTIKALTEQGKELTRENKSLAKTVNEASELIRKLKERKISVATEEYIKDIIQCGAIHRLQMPEAVHSKLLEITEYVKELGAENEKLTEKLKLAIDDIEACAPCFACKHFKRNKGQCYGANACREGIQEAYFKGEEYIGFSFEWRGNDECYLPQLYKTEEDEKREEPKWEKDNPYIGEGK